MLAESTASLGWLRSSRSIAHTQAVAGGRLRCVTRSCVHACTTCALLTIKQQHAPCCSLRARMAAGESAANLFKRNETSFTCQLGHPTVLHSADFLAGNSLNLSEPENDATSLLHASDPSKPHSLRAFVLGHLAT